MEIVIAQIEEYEQINKIAQQVHKIHVAWRPDIFIDTENPIEYSQFKELIKNKNIYVAKHDNEIMGYVIFSIKETFVHGMHDRKILKIEAIGVDEIYRHRGIGTNLIEYVMKTGKQSQCTDLYISVNEENTRSY